MWAKSIVTPVVLIPTLVILQISYGKPTDEPDADAPQNQTIIATELLIPPNSTDLERAEADVNSSLLLETASILLTVLAPNDTLNDSISSPVSSMLLDANENSTTEPEYYLDDGENDHNDTTFTNLTAASSTLSLFSSTLSDLEDVGDDDFDTMSMHVGSVVGATESSSSSLITEDEMDVAGSLDEAVTASVLLASALPVVVPAQKNRSTISNSKDEDDSIIVAMASTSTSSSNLNADTVESPPSHAENEGRYDGGAVDEATDRIAILLSTPASATINGSGFTEV